MSYLKDPIAIIAVSVLLTNLLWQYLIFVIVNKIYKIDYKFREYLFEFFMYGLAISYFDNFYHLKVKKLYVRLIIGWLYLLGLLVSVIPVYFIIKAIYY